LTAQYHALAVVAEAKHAEREEVAEQVADRQQQGDG
jgi:hypothetical protein